MFIVSARPKRSLRGLADPSESADRTQPYYEQYPGSTTLYIKWFWNGSVWAKDATLYERRLAGAGGFGWMPVAGTSSSGNPDNGGGGDNGIVKKTSPCPCRWENVKTVKYLTDEPKPGAYPVMVQTSKWVCDQPTNVQTKVLCEETNTANGNPTNGEVGTNTDATNTQVNGLFGLSDFTAPEVKYGGNVSVNSQPQESGFPEWAKWGLAATAGGVIVYLATQ